VKGFVPSRGHLRLRLTDTGVRMSKDRIDLLDYFAQIKANRKQGILPGLRGWEFCPASPFLAFFFNLTKRPLGKIERNAKNVLSTKSSQEFFRRARRMERCTKTCIFGRHIRDD